MALIGKSIVLSAALALLSIEASAQTEYRGQFANGAPSGYHIYRAPRFEPTQQPTQQRQAAPQRPAQQTPYGTRPNRR
jgi:hypothetical protein